MVSSGIQSLGQTGATVTTVVDGKGVTTAVQNGFGQNYMKAVMVVAGGLSGGLSSTVAGGNFWQGMRQGLITSGLNHLAHLTGEFLQKKDAELLVLLDSEGASGLGHMAELGGNDQNGWTFVSKDGKLNSDGNPLTTGPSKSTWIDKTIDSAFATKAGALSKLGRYEQWLSFKASYSDVMRGLNASYKNALTYYNAVLSNCADTVTKGLNGAGFPNFSGWDSVPNARFRQMRENYFGFRTPDYYNNYFHR